MATQVSISGSRNWAKIRSPVGVWALALITFGIYGWFWWYYINKELRDLGLARGVSGLGDNPGLSTVAWVLGPFAIYIPFVWTVVGTTKRIQTAQRLVGAEEMSGWLAGLLWVFTLGIGGIIYTQSSLNKVWHTQPIAPPGTTPGPAPTADADLERLKKLSDLKESGAISAEEFEAEKARLLPQQKPPPPQAPPPAPTDAPPPSPQQAPPHAPAPPPARQDWPPPPARQD